MATINAVNNTGTFSSPTINTPIISTPTIRLWDEWQDANETWTYASATTITVPTGAASRYKIGDKFKLTANSVVLYGYIVTVTDTLLTVAGNALTNNVFSANYISRSDQPTGFPSGFTHTATFTGFSSAPTHVMRYSVKGRTCFFSLFMSSTTSNATGFTATLPITAATVAGMFWVIPIATANDNGSLLTTNEYAYIASAGTTIVFTKGALLTGWTGSNLKKADIQGFYEI